MDLEDDLERELDELRAGHRLRATYPYMGTDRLHPEDASAERLLSFCSNDYLGLAGHPALADAAIRAVSAHGFGSGASRLVSGETAEHISLEQALARYLQCAAALTFPTGYQANLGVLTALAGPADLVVSDAANHASIIDGCRLTRARLAVYPHGDPDAAAAALASPGSFRRRLLVTESVFSMDGDRAPLAELASAARRHDAVFIVDEAHALGVAGPNGRGVAAELGILPDVLVGTLGKALGSQGGFVAGTTRLCALLVNRARQFIYTTAAAPCLVAAARAALDIASAAEGDRRRAHAQHLVDDLRRGLRQQGWLVAGQDLIVPLVLGAEERALGASAALRRLGILVPAIRPPTVAPGTSRLRITISAGHTRADIAQLLAAMAAAVPLASSDTPRASGSNVPHREPPHG